ETSGGESWGELYSEDYAFEFDGAWANSISGVFTRTPIVLANAIVGSSSWFYVYPQGGISKEQVDNGQL
ncbi:MAG: hypothetical protein IIT96_06055, partial [Muribaculaceae bacterium]|nr:hypothetical protein [Muribaculaceae bacterium]